MSLFCLPISMVHGSIEYLPLSTKTFLLPSKLLHLKLGLGESQRSFLLITPETSVPLSSPFPYLTVSSRHPLPFLSLGKHRSLDVSTRILRTEVKRMTVPTDLRLPTSPSLTPTQ